MTTTLCMALPISPAWAENYPEPGRTLTMVVPFGPGGASDAIGRALAQKFSEQWKVNTVVENKPGGEFMVGAAALATAKPDGYTMGLLTLGYVQNQIVKPSQRYNPMTDFETIGLVGSTPLALVVNGKSDISSFKDLQKRSAEDPASLTFSSCCTAMLFSVEMLKRNAGLAGAYIPYKGSVPSVNAVLGGDTVYTIDTAYSVKEFVKVGKLRALAVTMRDRIDAMPDVPNLTEVGVPGTFEMDTWYYLAFPKETPSESIEKANETLRKILSMPDIKKKFEQFVAIPTSSTPAEATKKMRYDFDRYSKLARENQLKFE
ncbi:Bug family tripartite tricarboxylate transporter substrate binding protein [Advenella kashmirensis]|nr:tripartite tricarboxylate transporter substrate-binding protein [Advenella kashmirensis]